METIKTNKLSVALLLLVAISYVGCKNSSEEQSKVEPIVETVEKPDSIYVCRIGANGEEGAYDMIYYTYDAAGNIICQLDSFLEKNIDPIKEKMEIDYNAKGLIIEDRQYSCYKSTPDRWHYDFSTQYFYDTNDRLSELVIDSYVKQTYTWSDDSHSECVIYNYNRKKEEDPWVAYQRIEYTYNAHKNIEKAVCYSLSGKDASSGGTLSYTQEYTYDQYGNIVSVERFEKDVVTDGNYYTYEYGANGKILVVWWKNSNSSAHSTSTTKYVYYY